MYCVSYPRNDSTYRYNVVIPILINMGAIAYSSYYNTSIDNINKNIGDYKLDDLHKIIIKKLIMVFLNHNEYIYDLVRTYIDNRNTFNILIQVINIAGINNKVVHINTELISELTIYICTILCDEFRIKCTDDNSTIVEHHIKVNLKQVYTDIDIFHYGSYNHDHKNFYNKFALPYNVNRTLDSTMKIKMYRKKYKDTPEFNKNDMAFLYKSYKKMVNLHYNNLGHSLIIKKEIPIHNLDALQLGIELVSREILYIKDMTTSNILLLSDILTLCKKVNVKYLGEIYSLNDDIIGKVLDSTVHTYTDTNQNYNKHIHSYWYLFITYMPILNKKFNIYLFTSILSYHNIIHKLSIIPIPTNIYKLYRYKRDYINIFKKLFYLLYEKELEGEYIIRLNDAIKNFFYMSNKKYYQKSSILYSGIPKDLAIEKYDYTSYQISIPIFFDSIPKAKSKITKTFD